MVSPRNATELEPQITLRGHSAPVTKLVHSPARHLLYSASLDATIRVWSVPPPSHTTYAPFDQSRERAVLVGHTDAVWDLALVREETLLVSCGADGMVKVWDVTTPNPALRLTWGYNGIGGEADPSPVIPATALEAVKTDLRTLAVAFQDGVIKLFDLDTGREVDKLRNQLSNGASAWSFDWDIMLILGCRRWLDKPGQQACLTPDDATARLWSRRPLYPHFRPFDW